MIPLQCHLLSGCETVCESVNVFVFALSCSFSTSVLREADGQRAVDNLLLKQVLLVEEQNDGRLCEPLVIADRVKELHALMHPVLGETGTNVEKRNHHRARPRQTKEMSLFKHQPPSPT